MLLACFGGETSLRMCAPYLFPSIAAVVIGGSYILRSRGGYLAGAGAASLTALVSVLLVFNMTDYGRGIIYGVVIPVPLLYGGEGRGLRADG